MRLLPSVHQREKIPAGFANREPRTTGEKRRNEKTAIGELHRRGKVQGAALRGCEHFGRAAGGGEAKDLDGPVDLIEVDAAIWSGIHDPRRDGQGHEYL